MPYADMRKTIVRAKEWRKNNRERYNKQKGEWVKNNPEKHKASVKKWQKKHPENLKKANKKYCDNNSEKRKEQAKRWVKKWAKNNRERVREQQKKWKEMHPENIKVAMAKCRSRRRRELGFNPLNKYFENSEAHHLDKINVLYIPDELHINIPHRQQNEDSMLRINLRAWDFMEVNVL